jgi:hypothetical protein
MHIPDNELFYFQQSSNIHHRLKVECYNCDNVTKWLKAPSIGLLSVALHFDYYDSVAEPEPQEAA